MRDLGREPLLHDVTVPGGRTVSVWQGQLNAAGVGIEIAEIELDQGATPGRLRQVWNARRAGQARPVIVFAFIGPEQILVCGPEGAPPPVATIQVALAERIFASVLNELPVPATRRAIDLLNRAQGSGQVPGFRNRGLVSTHYVTQVIRREGRAEWTEAAEGGARALGQVGEALIRSLGYRLEVTGPKEYRVQDDALAVALAHVYEDGTSLDRVGAGQAAPPSAIALKRARELGLAHALLVAGPLLRIYSLRGEETLDEGAASAAYVEFDTNLLPANWAPLLGALAAPDALRPNGRLDRLRSGSGRYAVALRERFSKRLYEDVVDRLVRGIDAAARNRIDPRPNEHELYRATLVVLFRLLFLLYAEDRDLLPMGNAEYGMHSITRMVISSAERQLAGQAFDATATSIWSELNQLFAAVSAGNADWGVPPYDGGLFADRDGLDGGLLRRVELPNEVVGPALVALGWDEGPDDQSGKIDFGDVGVRHIGTIYEGLLSYEVAFATQNLRVDRHAEGEPYVPAEPGETVDVPSGAPYVRSPQGGRKATGSYYTPVFAVDRLIDKALRPAIEEHLGRVGDDLDLPPATLFDFRMADLAMGSGHFLVAGLDALTERYATYLAAHPNREVRAELERARGRLNVVGDRYGAPQLGDRVADVDLLRRIVLKRCVYGVDFNEMAVELARLGLWLHSLVPGLPLSYLGANLQHGNSLVGVGTDVPNIGLFALPFEEEARTRAAEVASIDDLELGDIARGRELELQLVGATAGLHDYYDVATAGPLVDETFSNLDQLHAEEIIEGNVSGDIAVALNRATSAARAQGAFHWRLAFPTVFLRRDRPGFDVILGNPPWEETRVERLEYFARLIPGLYRLPVAQRERRVDEFAAQYTTERERYEQAVDDGARLNRYLGARYALMGAGNKDLYKAFAERFLDLIREGGRIGVVLPRSALAGDGTALFRERLFGIAADSSVDVLLNSRQWMFPDVHPQYTIILLSAQIAGSERRSITVSSVAADREAFTGVDVERTVWVVDELRIPHPDLAVPLFPSAAAAALYQRIVTSHPRFDSGRLGWRAVPWRELDGTLDRRSGLLKDFGIPGGWPALGGASFDIWRPDAWKEAGGDIKFAIEPALGMAEIDRKRQRSDVWTINFPRAVLRDPGSLPMHKARILFRKVTRSTDSRTVRVCLEPPNVFAHDPACTLLWPAGDELDQAYLLGVMSAVPFDWFARRRVEVNLNFFILNSLPVPRPPRDDPRWLRTVALSGRLASVDQRFTSFAEATGVTYGPISPVEKASMVAELDAVVAHLFGLDRGELALMFDDFPATDAGISLGRRAAILEHFDRWVL